MFLIISKFKLIILSFFLICQFSNITWSAEDLKDQHTIMPFKLGLEFQENSSLCKWANDNDKVQKKPLFFLSLRGDPLWHIVIDTSDIEFVTRPFCREEGEQLKYCLESIVSSVDVLHKLLTKNKEITFNDWLEELLNKFADSPFLFTTSHQNYALTYDKPINLPGDGWKPIVSPQATIQHPLEFTIPLYFGLFGFKSTYMVPFSASIPGRDLLLKAQEEGNSQMFWQIIQGLRQKTMGFMFLHALTLVQMTPVIETTDSECLENTLHFLNKASQVDAKMMLTLMSRRPFSQMWADLESTANYAQMFAKFMGLNLSFSLYEVPKRIKFTNYAEQFFVPSTGRPLDLSNLLVFFEAKFLSENKNLLFELLSKGVVSTTMLRNFKKDIKIDRENINVCDILDLFYEEAMNLVKFPQKRYIINIIMGVMESVDFGYDVLSPPHLLHESNAMGFLKDEAKHDPRYGEAVIEVRGISSVQPWFLRKCKLEDSLSGRFLISPDASLTDQGMKLFGFLSNFGTDQDFQDIALAMPFALRKY